MLFNLQVCVAGVELVLQHLEMWQRLPKLRALSICQN